MRTLTIIATIGLLIGCGSADEQDMNISSSSGDIEALKSKRDVLLAEEQRIQAELKEIEAQISAAEPKDNLPLVTVQILEADTFHHYVRLQGDVKTAEDVVLYAEYSGVLNSILVDEGQKVRKGQTLAMIDDGGLGQQLSQMSIQRDLAKTTFERQSRLWEQNIGSEMAYLQAKTNYEAQEEAVSQMERQLAKTSITAPFSGIVDDIITEQGNVVYPGQNPIMRIVDLDDMYIESSVPEAHLPNLKRGSDVKVEIPVLGETLNARVRQVGNYINPANRTFTIEVNLPSNDQSIKPNLTARLAINDYTSEEAILIPQSIISEDSEGKEYVYVIDSEAAQPKATRTYVETGKTSDDRIEILSGLKAGDKVIVEGARSVRDGLEVRIAS